MYLIAVIPIYFCPDQSDLSFIADSPSAFTYIVKQKVIPHISNSLKMKSQCHFLVKSCSLFHQGSFKYLCWALFPGPALLFIWSLLCRKLRVQKKVAQGSSITLCQKEMQPPGDCPPCPLPEAGGRIKWHTTTPCFLCFPKMIRLTKPLQAATTMYNMSVKLGSYLAQV